MTQPDRKPLRRPWTRLWLASAMFSAWMLFLLVGWAAGGAIHLLLVAALVLFPWRDETTDEPETAEPEKDDSWQGESGDGGHRG